MISASSGDSKIAWYKNHAIGGVESPPSWGVYTISTAAVGVVSVFAADLDGDGRLDGKFKSRANIFVLQWCPLAPCESPHALLSSHF